MSLNKFLRRSWPERFLFLEAFALLGLSRLVLLTIPFKKIAPRLSRNLEQDDQRSESSDTLQKIGWAVNAAARRTLWDSACFAQALAARIMLDRRGIPSTIYLGVKRDDKGKFFAHAWLRSGETVLTGNAGHEDYTILSTFASTKSL